MGAEGHSNPQSRFHPASTAYRYCVLLSVSLMLVGNYFAYDSIGALAPKAVGTAFGLMTMAQNVGLAVLPWIIGRLRDTTQDYTSGLLVFAALGLAGFLFSLLLKHSDAQQGGILEKVETQDPPT